MFPSHGKPCAGRAGQGGSKGSLNRIFVEAWPDEQDKSRISVLSLPAMSAVSDLTSPAAASMILWGRI